MVKFAYIYAMPGLQKSDSHKVVTEKATFIAAAVDYATPQAAIQVAQELKDNEGIDMIELCGGLANAELVAKVKQAVGPNVAVGQVMYGPEFRRKLVDLLKL